MRAGIHNIHAFNADTMTADFNAALVNFILVAALIDLPLFVIVVTVSTASSISIQCRSVTNQGSYVLVQLITVLAGLHNLTVIKADTVIADGYAALVNIIIDAAVIGHLLYLTLKIADTDISRDECSNESGCNVLSHHFDF